jgi:hypothetical protein|tara:strand:- start:755 stop:949 length:195 start_codon:yes stop_codon:yes gene_type:complete
MASSVDLQALLEASAGERLAQASASNNAFLQMLDRSFGKVYAEVDAAEAFGSRVLIQSKDGPSA